MKLSTKILTAAVVVVGTVLSLSLSISAQTNAATTPKTIELKMGDGISGLGPLFGIGKNLVNGQCTVGALGKDKAGRKIMLTAAHCVGFKTGEKMVKGGLFYFYKPQPVIGVTKKIFNTIDLKSGDPTQTNVLDVAVVQLNDNVKFKNHGFTIGKPVVGKEVIRSGNGIFSPKSVKGKVHIVYANDFDADMRFNGSPGDSGGPYMQGNQLVGIVSRTSSYFTVPWKQGHDWATRVDVVVKKLNKQGGVGAGFRAAAG